MSSSCNITVYTLVSSVKSSQNAVTLKQGESQILSCMISPINASNKQIEWKSSDEKIARVSTNGDGTAIVEAIANGTTVVTAASRTLKTKNVRFSFLTILVTNRSPMISASPQ